MSTEINHKNIFYPPGGILLWAVILMELLTFGVALIALVYFASQEPEVFHTSRLKLNVTYGTINTIFLLTSGYFMANTLQELKLNNPLKAKKHLLLTILFGFLFIVLKTIEYNGKIEAGLGLGYNEFFTFYWMLTLFHLSHVLMGLVFLFAILYKIQKGKSLNMENVESSATFWHMCDLIWLLLFPIIYLIL